MKAFNILTQLEELLYHIGFTWGWDDPVPDGKDYIQTMEKIFPGWSELKSHQKAQGLLKKGGQQDLFMPMCHKCEYGHKIEIQKK